MKWLGSVRILVIEQAVQARICTLKLSHIQEICHVPEEAEYLKESHLSKTEYSRKKGIEFTICFSTL